MYSGLILGFLPALLSGISPVEKFFSKTIVPLLVVAKTRFLHVCGAHQGLQALGWC